jgi:hypothetical protein
METKDFPISNGWRKTALYKLGRKEMIEEIRMLILEHQNCKRHHLMVIRGYTCFVSCLHIILEKIEREFLSITNTNKISNRLVERKESLK